MEYIVAYSIVNDEGLTFWSFIPPVSGCSERVIGATSVPAELIAELLYGGPEQLEILRLEFYEVIE